MDVQAPIRFPQPFFPFPRDVPARLSGCSTQGMRTAPHVAGGGAQKGQLVEGPGGFGPWLATLGPLTHTSSQLCSPRSPATSPLCVSQAAQQVSRGAQITSQGHLQASLAALVQRMQGALVPCAARAEPCPVPGSRRWAPPAAPSAQQEAAQVAGRGWTVWPGRYRVGARHSLAPGPEEGRVAESRHPSLRSSSHLSASCPCVAFVSGTGEEVWGLVSESLSLSPTSTTCWGATSQSRKLAATTLPSFSPGMGAV